MRANDVELVPLLRVLSVLVCDRAIIIKKKDSKAAVCDFFIGRRSLALRNVTEDPANISFAWRRWVIWVDRWFFGNSSIHHGRIVSALIVVANKSS